MGKARLTGKISIGRPVTGRDMERRQTQFALFLIIPSIIMIGLFIGYPLVYSFFLTFSKFTIQKVDWFAAGTSNYSLVFKDQTFWDALGFTLLYTMTYVVISMALGLLVAVLLQQVTMGGSIFRGILFLPTVIPVTMGLLMFQWVLDPNNGVLNHVLLRVLNRPDLVHNWLTDETTAFGTLVTVTLWGFGPWILLLAGLLAIPKDFYEAARVDGATRFGEFQHITLPLLRNTVMIVTTLQTIKALKLFVPIYVLTEGNPAGSTRSLYYLVFQKINNGQNYYAYATTVGWIFAAIVLVISILTTLIARQTRER
ncbi:MAG: sugar ABC transporter permease [Chloroflexota bacterium]